MFVFSSFLYFLFIFYTHFAVVFIVFSVFLFSYLLTCLWFFSVTKKWGSVDCIVLYGWDRLYRTVLMGLSTRTNQK